MSPGARIQAALELLAAIDAGDEPPDRVMDGYFRRRRYAGSGDRRAITERVYATLRQRAKLDWWIGRAASGLEVGPRARVLALLALDDKAAPGEIATLFSGARHCPPVLTEAEAEVVEALYGRPLLHREMPDDVVMEYPAWMDRSFRALWGERLRHEMSALNQTAPVDLRVNTLKASRETAEAALAETFVETEPTPLSPIGLRLVGRARLGGSRAFKEGLVEVQDEGSQLLSLLVGAAPGLAVCDFCAGAGGKTLALAAEMSEHGRTRGRLVACDVSEYRLGRMAPRLERAGAVGVARQTIRAKDDPWVRDNAGGFDRVLVDAPCTGTGTWRRNPTARWRFEPRDLEEFVATQGRILAEARHLVALGGRLIYATCSLLQEENERQLAAFLEAHPEFSALAIDRVWAETIGGDAPPTGPTLRLSPASTGTDGFFCAVLQRDR